MSSVINNIKEIFGNNNFDQILQFSEIRNVSKFSTILEQGNPLDSIYIVLDGHFVKYKNQVAYSLYSPGDVIGISLVYDYSKKLPVKVDGDIVSLDILNTVLIISRYDIKNLTDKERLVFAWVLENIKNEKSKKI